MKEEEEEEEEKEKLDYNGKGFKIGDLVENINLLDSMRFGIVTAVKPEDISTEDVLNYFNHFHGVEEASIDSIKKNFIKVLYLPEKRKGNDPDKCQEWLYYSTNLIHIDGLEKKIAMLKMQFALC